MAAARTRGSGAQQRRDRLHALLAVVPSGVRSRTNEATGRGTPARRGREILGTGAKRVVRGRVVGVARFEIPITVTEDGLARGPPSTGTSCSQKPRSPHGTCSRPSVTAHGNGRPGSSGTAHRRAVRRAPAGSRSVRDPEEDTGFTRYRSPRPNRTSWTIPPSPPRGIRLSANGRSVNA